MSRPAVASAIAYVLAIALGAVAFLLPLVSQPAQEAILPSAQAPNSPIFLSLLIGVCVIALLLDAQASMANIKMVALLGILVAINSSLRFVETAIPGPAGFSPMFFLIVFSGYVFGGRFGFLMGAFTLLVSGLITGGIGPWLPYQMFAAGLVGLSAPLCKPATMLFNAQGRWGEVALLGAFAALWGLLYGAIMNISFWPYMMGTSAMHWEPGAGMGETMTRFLAYYAATSLVWDVARLAGNLILSLALGSATLRVLRRFRERFTFQYTPESAAAPGIEP
jgi:energy-coupling factor transport system substrate-specific component